MKKSTFVSVKKGRGGRGAGRNPVSTVRIPVDLTQKVDAWARKSGAPSRVDAIRCLVELGLTVNEPPVKRRINFANQTSNELFAKTVNRLFNDPPLTVDQADQEPRKKSTPSERIMALKSAVSADTRLNTNDERC